MNAVGAPTQIVNALGQVTSLYRESSTFPAFVTRIVRRDGTVLRAQPDIRGNLASHTIENALGDLSERTVQYRWDPTWDAVTSIVQPLGDSIASAYDPANGNLLWTQDGRGAASRTSFRYWNSGVGANLLQGVTYPSTRGGLDDRDSLVYDALGNPTAVLDVTDSSGVRLNAAERWSSDAIGRPERSCRDITPGGLAQCTLSNYDVMNRVVTSTDSGPALAGAPAQAVFVRSFYTADGQVDSLTRQASDGSVGAITTRWRYNRLGNAVEEIAPDGQRESRRYDEVGNLISVTSRRGLSIAFEYDAIDRLIRRVEGAVTHGAETPPQSVGASMGVPYPRLPNNPGLGYTIPGDTAQFGYDALDRVRTAVNRDARVVRSYFPGGDLDTDSLYIRGASGVLLGYGLQLKYDANGRRLLLLLPEQLTAPGNRHQYEYVPETGRLRSVINEFGVYYSRLYNLRDEVVQLQHATGVQPWIRRLAYDASGYLAADTLNQFGGLFFRQARFSTDARGKRLSTTDALGFQEQQQFEYSGLGHLRSSRMRQLSGLVETVTRERYQMDALANPDTSNTIDSVRINGQFNQRTERPRRYRYRAGVGRLDSLTAVGANRRYRYDASGNVQFDQHPDTRQHDDRMAYYGADERLRAVDARTYLELEPGTLVFEEYGYDAFGRRVWVRTDRRCEVGLYFSTAVACDVSTWRRTVWDGDRELAEIQVPIRYAGQSTSVPDSVQNNDRFVPALPLLNGEDPNPFFGRVVYVPGLALDQPAGLTRYGYVGRRTGTLVSHAARSLALHWNGLGALSRVSCGDGALVCVALSGGPTPTPDTMVVSVPAYWAAFARPAYRVQAFQGTLLTDKADATGTYFRRNRHYDPVSARFTQEDPIGLAGGLNLYGFAGGDPVNFGDPFGLCPTDMGGDGKRITLGDCPLNSTGWAEFNRRASGRVEDAGWGDPLLFVGGTAVRGGTAAAGATKRIFSARVLERMSSETLHDFPQLLGEHVMKAGTRTVKSSSYVEYTQRGFANGRPGTFEVGARPSVSGRTELITHWFFRPDKR